MVFFFSSVLYHKVTKFQPTVQTVKMKKEKVTPGRVGTVFFFPKDSLQILKGKYPGWAVRTAFGTNPSFERTARYCGVEDELCPRAESLVIESPVRSGYLPFLALTETLTGHTKSQISN